MIWYDGWPPRYESQVYTKAWLCNTNWNTVYRQSRPMTTYLFLSILFVGNNKLMQAYIEIWTEKGVTDRTHNKFASNFETVGSCCPNNRILASMFCVHAVQFHYLFIISYLLRIWFITFHTVHHGVKIQILGFRLLN